MSKIPHTILGCGVMVYRENRGILLAQRIAPGKPGYGLYAMPGGTVERGESPEVAAEREVLEETGMEVVTLDRGPLWHWAPDWHPAWPWLTLYFIATTRGEPVNTEPEKQSDWGWYAPDRLPHPLWHGIRELAGSLGLL